MRFNPEDVGTEVLYIGQSHLECAIIPHMTEGKKYTLLEIFGGASGPLVAVENDCGIRSIFMEYRFKRIL